MRKFCVDSSARTILTRSPSFFVVVLGELIKIVSMYDLKYPSPASSWYGVSVSMVKYDLARWLKK